MTSRPRGTSVSQAMLDGALDDDLEVALLLLVAHGEDLVLHVPAVEGGVLGEHLEGSGVGGKLVVGVVEVRLAVLVERLHGDDLATDFVLHERIDFVEEAGFARGALAQNEADGARERSCPS